MFASKVIIDSIYRVILNIRGPEKEVGRMCIVDVYCKKTTSSEVLLYIVPRAGPYPPTTSPEPQDTYAELWFSDSANVGLDTPNT